MTIIAVISICIVSYILITLESLIHIHKTPVALLGGILSWAVVAFFSEPELVNKSLFHSMGEISEILFFLLGAMTIVEVVDANQGFEIFRSIIKTRNKWNLLFQLSVIVFILSAILDNLTASIVGVSIARMLVRKGNDRMIISGMIILAANAGGVWSPLGDVTTTMLWIGGQLDIGTMVLHLILPAIICFIVPILFLKFVFKGNIEAPESVDVLENDKISQRDRIVILVIGMSGILLAPIFKLTTHLPPYTGMLLSLSIIWILVEWVHKRTAEETRVRYTISGAIQRIDTPSILFFLGILLQVGALAYSGVLTSIANGVSANDTNHTLFATLIGLASAVIDNVPLVAAMQEMFDLHTYPQNHILWKSLAYTCGTGGSALIIGSAAGVAVMGMEDIPFIWYLKRITPLALLGFFSGVLVLWLIS